MPWLSKGQRPGDKARRAAVLPRSLWLLGSSWGCGDKWQGREKPVRVFGDGTRRKFASGEVVHSAWDSTDHWKSVTCSRKDALVPVPQC